MSVANGGTQAPGGRGRRKRTYGQQGLGIAVQARGRGGSGFPAAPPPGKGLGPSPGLVDRSAQAGLGAQLSRRVQSGAIDQQQAQQTADQRALLAKAFGPNWRTKVFGDRGYAQRTRTALAKDPQNASVAALNKKLMERRKQMLAAAKTQVGG